MTVRFISFSYNECTGGDSNCQMEFRDFELKIDNVVTDSADSFTPITDGNPVDLSQISILEERKLQFKTGPLGIFFKAYDKGNDLLIDDVTENIRDIFKRDMSLPQTWENHARKRNPAQGGESELIFYIELQCSTNFTGVGCKDCIEHHYTTTCDIECIPQPNKYTCSDQGVKECQNKIDW